jgi:hypothetical protein
MMPRMPGTEAARPLTDEERRVLEHVLSLDFEGAVELRAQLERTEVAGTWSPGSPSLHLRVRRPAPPAPLVDRLVPVRAVVDDATGSPVGELLVWLDDGYLNALEYAWVTDEMPGALPPLERIHLAAHPAR